MMESSWIIDETTTSETRSQEQWKDLFTVPFPSTRSAHRRRVSIGSQSIPMSESDQSEILSPIPRRHASLQSSENLRWLRATTPDPFAKPSSSRPSFLLRRSSDTYASFAMEPPWPVGQQQPSSRQPKEKGPESGFARRWLRWMHKNGLKSWILPCVVLSTTLLKWCTSLGSYSGQNTPPLFGDYEAQRHWMEITIHLPISQWYTYDLLYWGLDYPPITAYVSWLCGTVGSWINPPWFALDDSRGIETQDSKVFMRSSVLALDVIYMMAVVMFTRACQANRSTKTQNLTLITLLTQPALLLIDHGHFQYNSVMLGFTLLSLTYLSSGRDVVASVFFVASLGFKQMTLYYAPAIGSYLLGKCLYLGPNHGRRLFIQLALTTTTSFIVIFLPFLPPFSSPRAIMDPISRIFPFFRGLFEDKVANFWCFSNVFVKWKDRASSGTLVKLSTALTALGFLPSVAGMLRSGKDLQVQDQDGSKEPKETDRDLALSNRGPLFRLLPWALLTSSLSFFLFSFQVHEKTILVPLLPLTLIMTNSVHESAIWEWGMLGNNVGVFSMWPLLKRDGLAVQYVALLAIWNASLGYFPFKRPSSFIQLVSLVVSTGCIVLHGLELLVSPPARYPDIYPVLNVMISTPVFILIWLWSIKCGVEAGWALSGIGGKRVDLVDWERERERRWSIMSRDLDDASSLAASEGIDGRPRSVSLNIRSDREGNAGARARRQVSGMSSVRRRVGSFRRCPTPLATEVEPTTIAEVDDSPKTS